MPSLQELAKLDLKAPSLSVSSLRGLGGLGGGRSGKGSEAVGLDVQPGYVAAVQAHANGSLVVKRAAGRPLPPETVREGEILDESLLTETLRDLFGDNKLSRRVRLGVANQRTVLRVLELPPIDDRKALEAAVRFQAQDHMPMPLNSAVLDFHPMGIVETPAGPRQRVVVVAAQLDMVNKLLSAVTAAGLRPVGVDLSAFAMIRALHRKGELEPAGENGADANAEGENASESLDEQPAAARSTLYLNVGGLTNLAIAEGLACRFTRMVSGGLESMASELAERHSIALGEARELLGEVNLAGEPSEEAALSDARGVLSGGVREISGEVRNSLDFHRSQGGGEVSEIVLSGAALEIQGFAEALEAELGTPIVRRRVATDGSTGGDVPAERLTIAAGLAVEEVAA